MITILDSTINIIGRKVYDYFNEHENLHYENAQDFQTISENYEESDYNLKLALLTMPY